MRKSSWHYFERNSIGQLQEEEEEEEETRTEPISWV